MLILQPVKIYDIDIFEVLAIGFAVTEIWIFLIVFSCIHSGESYLGAGKTPGWHGTFSEPQVGGTWCQGGSFLEELAQITWLRWHLPGTSIARVPFHFHKSLSDLWGDILRLWLSYFLSLLPSDFSITHNFCLHWLLAGGEGIVIYYFQIKRTRLRKGPEQGLTCPAKLGEEPHASCPVLGSVAIPLWPCFYWNHLNCITVFYLLWTSVHCLPSCLHADTFLSNH